MFSIAVRRISWRLTLRVVASISLCGGILSAQKLPVFRQTVQHVQLDVVVTDSGDRPVGGLTADEFEVRESGRLQKIEDFAAISVPLGNGVGLDPTGQPRPEADTFSNAPPPRSGRAFVFLVIDTPLSNIIPTKRVLTEFMRTLLPDDEVAVVYAGRSDLSQDFTRDPIKIVRAFDHVAEALLAPKNNLAITLRSVVASLAAAREARRVLVIITSDGLPGPDREAFEAFESAKRLGIPVYGLDPMGLVAPPLNLDAHMEEQTPERRMAIQQGIFLTQQSTLAASEYTGGRGFVNQPYPIKSVDDLMADNGTYYLLGYYPQPYVDDGHFHHVEVRVKRPGVRVRARDGYIATVPHAPREGHLADVLADGLPGGDLPVRAVAAPLAPHGNRQAVALTVDITYPAVDSSDAKEDQLDMVWLAVDPDAKIRASGKRTLRMPLDSGRSSSLVVSIDDVLDLPRSRLILRVAVSSRRLATFGSVHIPIAAEDVSGPLGLSPIILGAQPSERLRIAPLGSANVLPFPPTTRRDFPTDGRLPVLVRCVSGDGKAVHVRLEIMRNGRTLISNSLTLEHVKSDRRAEDAVGMVDIASLPSGDYIIRVTAATETSGSVERSVAITVKEQEEAPSMLIPGRFPLARQPTAGTRLH